MTKVIEMNNVRKIKEKNEKNSIFDKSNRLVFARNTYKNGEVIEHNFSYDEEGHLIKYYNSDGYESRYEHNEFGAVSKFMDNDGHAIVFTYDNEGNCVSEEKETGETRTHAFDNRGLVISTKRFDGIEAVNTYNPRTKELIRIDQSDNKTFIVVPSEIGNMTLEFDFGSGNSSPRKFDFREIIIYSTGGTMVGRRLNDKNAQRYRNVQDISFGYDEDGQIIKTSINENAKYIDRNALGLVLHSVYEDENPVNSEETWMVYDDNGNFLASIKDNGQYYFEYHNEDNTVAYAYNGFGDVHVNSYREDGRIEKITKISGGKSKFYINEFDENDRLKSAKLILENGEVVEDFEYSYYLSGDTKTSVNKVTGDTISYEYDAAGNVIKKVYSDGFIELMSYDTNCNLITYENSDGRRDELQWSNGNLITRLIRGFNGLSDFEENHYYIGEYETSYEIHSI